VAHDAAAAWLGARRVARALDAAVAAASGLPPCVLELARWLERHPADASLARAAWAMARAPRSLQRDLRAAGTTFAREVARARVRLAQRLLAGGDASLTEIAYEIGCASPQHFSTLFRRVVGVSPSRWRRRAAR
jgi:AraC-like DNA-binding protein